MVRSCVAAVLVLTGALVLLEFVLWFGKFSADRYLGGILERSSRLRYSGGQSWNPLDALPDELRSFGRRLFASMNRTDFDEYVAGTAEPRTLDLGNRRSIVVVRQKHEDDSNPWSDVQKDITVDEYGILKGGEVLNGTMIDVGSNIGMQAIVAAKFHRGMQVIALEPIPTTYFYLLWNMQLNGVRALTQLDLSTRPHGPGGILALNSAASRDGRTRAINFDVYGDSEHASWSNPPEIVTLSRRQILRADVQSVTISNLLGKYQIQTAWMLKIDCEGCEHEVLSSMGQKYLCNQTQFRRVAGELHYANQRTLAHTAHLLDSCRCGFTFGENKTLEDMKDGHAVTFRCRFDEQAP